MNNHSYWYIGLGVLSIILYTYVYLKIRKRRLFLFLLIIIGCGFFIEAIIYNMFQAYQYYPKLFKANSTYDSDIGAIFSNAFALPAAASYLAAFRKDWKWIMLVTAIFIGIDWLFVQVEVYRHNWWNNGLAVLGFPVFFFVAKKMYQKVFQPVTGFWYYVLLYFAIGPISGLMHIFPIMFLKNRYYVLNWYSKIAEDTNALAAIYYLVLCLLLTYMVISQIKFSWIIIPALVLVINVLLIKWGILKSLVWWDLYYYVILSLFMLWVTKIFSKLFENGPTKK